MFEQQQLIECKSTPLAGSELSRLAQLLYRVSGEVSFNVEFLDGFSAALIVGPVTGAPEQYFERILRQHSIAPESAEAIEAAPLFVRHWRSIELGLQQGLQVGPLLCDEDRIEVSATRWARGFLQGMQLHFQDWAPLLYDEQQNAALFPLVKLAGTRPATLACVAPGDAPYPAHAALLTDMSIALLHIYRFFSSARRYATHLPASKLH